MPRLKGEARSQLLEGAIILVAVIMVGVMLYGAISLL
jgi:hypothetical protein